MKSRLNIRKTRKLFINGVFPRSESERYFKWTSSDGEETVNISRASRKDFRGSVRAARKAVDGWKNKTAYNRGQILYRMGEMMEGRKKQLVQELCLEGLQKKQAEFEVNSAIDERYHLEKATEAACVYLKESYNQFGSWTMAAAAYNMGKNRAKRNIGKQSTDNYYNLYLNSETGRYVFRIIAVKEILENPNIYGFIFRDKDLYLKPEYNIVHIYSTIKYSTISIMGN